MTGREEFFGSVATIFVGERGWAGAEALRVARGLAGAGLSYEWTPCLQHEHVQVYHRGALYRTQRDIDGFVRYAKRRLEWHEGAGALLHFTTWDLRVEYGATTATVPTPDRLDLRDHRHAVETLSPLVGRRMRLATRDGRLAFGNWWLGSLGAGTFEVAGDFGLLPPACGYDGVREPATHVILEVWPTADGGGRLDGVRGKPHTTTVHVPFGHDIALHLVGGGAGGAGRRTDENLRGVFG